MLYTLTNVQFTMMSTKIKRTYNISREAVATVKRLVDERHLAPSQDVLVELAIAEYARRIRDVDDARLWQAAGNDAEFHAQTERRDTEFADATISRERSHQVR